jgi:hypothetical protein
MNKKKEKGKRKEWIERTKEGRDRRKKGEKNKR